MFKDHAVLQADVIRNNKFYLKYFKEDTFNRKAIDLLMGWSFHVRVLAYNDHINEGGCFINKILQIKNKSI